MRMKWREQLLAKTVLAGVVSLGMPSMLAAGTVVFAPGAMAQSSVGQVYGDAPAGARVVLKDLGTGATTSTSANAQGRYSFNQVAPGRYSVTANEFTREVSVVGGLGIDVSLGADVVVITGNSQVNPIDVRSVESTTILTAEQIDSLPINRELSSVALLAPGTVKNASPTNFGDVVSIGGSSVAENGYYINGFDVTNIRTFLSYADLPYDAVAQQQVKTGGYGAEYGRSLGGVISLITKRGSNEWKFGGSVSYSPEEWAGKARDARSVDPQNIASGDIYTTGADGQNGYNSEDGRTSMYWTNYASGPIIEDMLFVYGAVEFQDVSSDTYGRNTSRHSEYDTPQYIGKVDFYPFDGQHFEYTGIVNTDLQHVTDYSYSDPDATYVGEHQDKTGSYDVERGGEVHIFKYTGQFFDNLTVSLQHGQLESVNAATIPAIPNLAAAACLAAYDSRGNAAATNYIGCWDENFFTIPDLNSGVERDIRKADRIDVDYVLGDHTIRFGYDKEDFSSSKRGETYSGGGYWRYYQRATDFTVNGTLVPANTLYARYRDYGTGSSSYDVENEAWYIEDSWQFNENLLLYAGIRSESFANYNSLGEKFVDSQNEIAPRLGFSWDVNGDASLKVFGNAGRYYIPVASNTNIRASGVEFIEESFFYVGGINEDTGAPTSVGAQIGPTNLNGSKVPPSPESVASESLEPMYQDEYILGIQNQFTEDLTLGVRGIYREVNNGMDDHCSYGPYQNWAADQGYTNFDYHVVAPCQIINPGKDVTLAFDNNDTGTITSNTIAASYFDLPEYERSYQALEFFGQLRGDNFNLNASYTLSKTEGNVEGYVNSGLGQADAGLTQDFDNFLFEKGANGPLPNDRTHVIKMFGNYDFTDEFSVGGNLLVMSGRPISCLGFVDLNDPDLTAADRGQLAAYSASSFFCANEDGTKTLRNRGDFGRTDWTYTVDMQLAYKPARFDGNVGFYIDIQNLLDTHDVLQVNERSQKGTSAAPEYNPDFLQPTGFQAPRRITFTARYNF